MQINVLVEPVANNGFRATAASPFAVCADGATADEAVRRLQSLVTQRLADGAKLMAIEVPVPASENPWLAAAGIYDPNDPLIAEWKQLMAEYRQSFENDPNRP